MDELFGGNSEQLCECEQIGCAGSGCEPDLIHDAKRIEVCGGRFTE